MRIVPLHTRRASVPDFDGSVLARRDHPFPFAVKTNAGDVVCMAFELEHRVGIRRLDVVEFHGGVASGSEESLVGGDTEAIDL